MSGKLFITAMKKYKIYLFLSREIKAFICKLFEISTQISHNLYLHLFISKNNKILLLKDNKWIESAIHPITLFKIVSLPQTPL